MDFKTIIKLLALKAMEQNQVAEFAAEMIEMSVHLAAHGDMSKENFLEMTESMVKEFDKERERHQTICMKSGDVEEIDALNVAEELFQRMRNQGKGH